MTSIVHQQQSPASALQCLTLRLQQLTNSLSLSSNDSSNLSLSGDVSNLIAQLKTALTSLEVELLHQKAITQGTWDFFPTPQPIIEKMLNLAQIEPGMKVLA